METRPLSYACVLALALMTTPVSADVRLSNEQILAHVSGNTLKIVTANLQEARGYFSPDGTLKGRDGDRDFVGKWKVENDMLCMDIPQFENTLCRNVFVRGDLILLFTQTGEPAGRIEVTKGDPDLY
jgi:hypothetical protein